MRKIQFIDAFRGIQKRFVSFLSIVLIVMLGTAGFFITQYVRKGMEETGYDYYEKLNFKDFQMMSSLGVSDDDVRTIKKIDGVKDAEGVLVLDGKFVFKNLSSSMTLLTVSERICKPEIVEGALPVKENECTVSADFASGYGMKIGDTISLSASFNSEDVLKNRQFKIVGLHHHPDYLRTKGTFNVLVAKSAIDTDVTNGLYTRVFITEEKDKKISLFSEENFKREKKLKERLEDLAADLQVSSIEFYKKLGNQKIDEEWAKAKVELDDAQNQINEGQQTLTVELSKAQSQIAAGRSKLNSGYNELIEGQIKIEAGESELNANLAAFRIIQTAIDAAGINLDTARSQAKEIISFCDTLLSMMESVPDEELVNKSEKAKQVIAWIYENGNEKLDVLENSQVFSFVRVIALYYTGFDLQTPINVARNALAILNDLSQDDLLTPWNTVKSAFETLRSVTNTIVNKIDEINSSKQALANARTQLDNAKRQLANGWSEYYSGKDQLAAAQSQMAAEKEKGEIKIQDAQNLLDEKTKEAQDLIAEARKKLDSVTCTWLVTDRNGEAGYVELKNNTGALANAGKVFGALFAFVGGLVTFSTLIIIIEEERKYVGTSKAFGFKNNEILGKYLLFGVLSVTLGCILGTIVAYVASGLIQGLLADTGMFNFGRAANRMNVPVTIIVSICAIVASTLVTILSCTGLLKSPASVLMKGEVLSSKKNKKVEKGSSKSSLYSRMIIRNMLNDKARVIISIIIIAGSVLIIGSGISINDGFKQMIVRQVNDIYKYDVRIDLDNSVDEQQKAEIEKALKRNNALYAYGYHKSILYKNDGNLDGLELIVMDPEVINYYIDIRDPKTKKIVELPSSGFLAQIKLVERFDLKEGDSWILFDETLNKHYAKYEGIFNNYAGRIIVMSKEAYETDFNTEMKDNCIYVNLDGGAFDRLSDALLNINDQISFDIPSNMMAKFEAMSGLYDVIVYTMIGISVLMSFTILANLANIFITRKKKELIVMRINGFSINKTRAYLSRETIVTTILGLIIGSLIGMTFLANFSIKMMEGKEVQFVRDIDFKAWAIAMILEGLFALMIYTISFKKIKNLNFREI